MIAMQVTGGVETDGDETEDKKQTAEHDGGPVRVRHRFGSRRLCRRHDQGERRRVLRRGVQGVRRVWRL
jgi:hypothetical protein